MTLYILILLGIIVWYLIGLFLVGVFIAMEDFGIETSHVDCIIGLAGPIMLIFILTSLFIKILSKIDNSSSVKIINFSRDLYFKIFGK